MLAAGNFTDWYAAVGEIPWGYRYRRHRRTVTESLYCTRGGIVGQCRSSRNSRERPRRYQDIAHLGLYDFINVRFAETTFCTNLHDPLQSFLTTGAIFEDHRLRQTNRTNAIHATGATSLTCNISQWREWLVAITSSVPQSVIDIAVDRWRTRLRACVNAKGLHFEHLLYLASSIKNIVTMAIPR